MNEKQIRDAMAVAKERLARYNMVGFTWYTFETYKMGWVHEEICARLDQFLRDVIEKKSPRLMLMMPPRHGKSEIVSRRFPAYALGRYPDLEIIAASYSAELSSRHNTDVQRIMDSPAYRNLYGIRLPRAGVRNGVRYRRTSDLFDIAGHQGSYRSAGVCGSITGMGCDILIIDDPVKDRAEAESSTTRRKIYDWYTGTAYPRLQPGGGALVIMTRWHTDDLCGRLLEEMKTGGEQWEVIEYPALATMDEEHRKIGEPLHPARYDLKTLLNIKRVIGTRDWEALYQQHPVVDGGNIFKEEWFQYYTTVPKKFDEMIISWDMTFKDTSSSDFVVGQVWGKIGADCYLLDQVRGRMSFTQTKKAFLALAKKWPRATLKLIEDKANGPAIIDEFKHVVQGIVPVDPEISKTARAHAVTSLFEAGNVYLPKPDIAPWMVEYILELTQFPTGAHDDQVDATTQALRKFSTRHKMRFNPLNLRSRYGFPI